MKLLCRNACRASKASFARSNRVVNMTKEVGDLKLTHCSGVHNVIEMASYQDEIKIKTMEYAPCSDDRKRGLV